MSNQTSGSDSQSISTSSEKAEYSGQLEKMVDPYIRKRSEADDFRPLHAGMSIRDSVPNPRREGIPPTDTKKVPDHDPVNHPRYYTAHPSGVECIEITEHMNFTLGNAVKYIWRADSKNGIEDLEKAAWYINREIKRRSQ